MAGQTALRPDPAFEKYYQMTANRWKYFRWTPRGAYIGFMYVVFVPSVMGYWFWKTDGKWNMRGKLRGDTISEW